MVRGPEQKVDLPFGRQVTAIMEIKKSGGVMEMKEKAQAGKGEVEGGTAEKYLTFSLGGEEYGISILSIREIIGMIPVTSVPQSPPYVKGVVNLRGKVIPVIDLRKKFAMESIDYTERTCIIVVEMELGTGVVLIGIIVDSVSEVLNIRADEVEPTPTFGARLTTDYILGLAKMEGGVKILLDMDKVLGAMDVRLVCENQEIGPAA